MDFNIVNHLCQNFILTIYKQLINKMSHECQEESSLYENNQTLLAGFHFPRELMFIPQRLSIRCLTFFVFSNETGAATFRLCKH